LDTDCNITYHIHKHSYYDHHHLSGQTNICSVSGIELSIDTRLPRQNVQDNLEEYGKL